MREHVREIAVIGAVLLALTGCGSAPPAPERTLAAPRVTTVVAHAFGASLRGDEAGPDGRTRSAAVVPAASYQAVVQFIALMDMPEGELEPLAKRARYFASLAAERPLATAPRLFAGARAGSVTDMAAQLSRIERGELGPHVALSPLRGALPEGVTARFEVRGDFPGAPGTVKSVEGAAISVHRARRGGREWLDVSTELSAARATTTGAMAIEQEVAALDLTPLRASNGLMLILPEPFPETPAQAILVLITVTAPPRPGAVGAAMHDGACFACAADLAHEAALAGGRGKSDARDTGETVGRGAPDLATVRRALTMPERRRDALLSLAALVGASFAEDMSFADDALLGPTVAAVSEELERFKGGPTEAALAWVVERGAIRGALAAIGPAGTPPILDAALVRRVGAVGRLPAALLGRLERASDAADFDRRIAAGNFELLEDGDPAMRVRAYDWLAAHGGAPPGFEPLAPSPARRVALEEAAIAAEGRQP